MRCEEFQAWMEAVAGRLSPEAEAHAAQCLECRAMFEAMASLADASPQPSGLRQRLLALAAGAEAVRPLAPAWMRATKFSLVLALVSGIGVAVLGGAGWRALAPGAALLLGAWLVLGIGVAVWMLTRLMIPGLSVGRWPLLLPVAAAACYALIVATWFDSQDYSRFVPIAAACFAIGSGHAILVASGVVLLLRTGWVTEARQAALAGMALSAFGGILVLTVFCAHHDFWHLVWGHLSVLALVPIAGLGLARSFAAKRGR